MKFQKKNIFLYLIIAAGILFILFQLFIFRNQSWETYPYIHQDFWRRLEDAQYYLGLRSTGQFHPPIISLIYSIFLSLGINQLYILNFIVHAAFAVLIFLFCKKFSGSAKAAFITALLYLFNFAIIQQANYLGLGDLFASFVITLGIYIFVVGKNSRRSIIITGIILGLAGLIQYSGIFSIPVIILAILLTKDLIRKAKIKNIVLLCLSSGLIFASFFLYRYISFGNPFYSQVEHFGFLRPTLANIGIYLFFIVAFFKIPVLLVSAFGVPKILKNRSEQKFILLLLPSVIFFIFFYLIVDWRFISYLIPIVYLLFCEGGLLIYKHVKKHTAVVAFLATALVITVIYNSLYLNGDFGIAIRSNNIIKTEVVYENGFPHYSIVYKTAEPSFNSYFLLDNNWENRSQIDSEVTYFTKTVNYQDVLNIKDLVQDKNYILILDQERFVRYHQFNVAFKKNTILDPSAEELANTQFIISDKLLTFPTIDRSAYKLVQKVNNLYVYAKLED